jgi:hypothetical protein
MNINDKINELLEGVKERNEWYEHKDTIANNSADYREIQLLQAGITDYTKESYGFLIANKWVIAVQKNKWRIKGKAKWYYFKNIEEFKNRYL